MRDTVKTLAGLVIIAVIVVATFLYGNAQRQSQLKHDQQIKNQQAKSTVAPQIAKAKPATSTKQATDGTPAASTAPNTAPVQTPQSNSLQGGSTPTPTPTLTPAVTPVPSPIVAVAPSATPLPQTGSSLGGMLGVAAIVAAILGVRYSRQSLLAAVRSRR